MTFLFQNVSFKGDYLSNDIKIADAQLVVVYSNDPDKKVYLSANLEDHSNIAVRNFTFEIAGSHPATNLELLVKGKTDFRRRWYHANSLARYKRTYLPLQMAELHGKLDLLNHEIEYEVSGIVYDYHNATKVLNIKLFDFRKKLNANQPTYGLSMMVLTHYTLQICRH